MEAVYAVTFGVLAALAAVFELTKPKEGQQSTSQDFLRFRFNYVVVYSLMMGAGPCLARLLARPDPQTDCVRSRRLAAGPLCVRTVPALRLRQGGHRQPLHRRLRVLHGLWHARGLARRQDVGACCQSLCSTAAAAAA